MIRLRPFKKQDIDRILPWLTDERVLALWGAGKFSYPLTKEQLTARLETVEETEKEWVMAALDAQGTVVGHLYMWPDYEKNSLHLGMIVVDDARRGQGLGCQMLQKAVEYAFDILGMQKVTLGVFDCNFVAHACYMKAGFRDVGMESHALEFHGEVWNRILMAIERNG